MKKIMGYKLKNVPVEKVDMPVHSYVFSAMDVNGEPTVFAIIDPEEVETLPVTIYRVTTGKAVLDNVIVSNRYIGSFSVANYGIVYHFYVEAEKKHQEYPVATLTVEPKDAVNIKSDSKPGPPEYPFQI